MRRGTIVSETVARHVIPVCFFAIFAAWTVITPVAAQSVSGDQYTASRTAWGHPDFEGIWTMETFTPLERPGHLGDQELYTDAEFDELQRLLTASGVDPLAGNVLALEDVEARESRLYQDNRDTIHYDNALWLRGNTPKGLSSRRTSLIVAPSTGRLPARTEAAVMADAERRELRRDHQFDSLQMRPFSERCVVWPHEGPPMVPPAYNDLMQIMQIPGYVVMFQEMRTNQARIIPIDGRPHISDRIRQFAGDSRGYWKGDTLVVESTNFTGKTRFQRVATAAMHVVERFTRVAENSILYEFTVTDPDAWVAPWSVEIPMMRRNEEMYEYACHEGNHDIGNILTIHRNIDKQVEDTEGR